MVENDLGLEGKNKMTTHKWSDLKSQLPKDRQEAINKEVNSALNKMDRLRFISVCAALIIVLIDVVGFIYCSVLAFSNLYNGSVISRVILFGIALLLAFSDYKNSSKFLELYRKENSK